MQPVNFVYCQLRTVRIQFLKAFQTLGCFFDITAFEIESPGSRVLSSASVNMMVTDSNDNDPRFEQQEYRMAVAEDAPPGTQVGEEKTIKVFFFAREACLFPTTKECNTFFF